MICVLEPVLSFLCGPDVRAFPLTCKADGDKADDGLIQLCDDPRSLFRVALKRLYTRLKMVQSELKLLGVVGPVQAVLILLDFLRAVALFETIVTKQHAQNLLVRFSTKRHMLEKLWRLHEDVDVLFAQLGRLGVKSGRETDEWESTWKGDCNAIHEVFGESMSSKVNVRMAVQGLTPEELTEVLFTLKYELEHRAAENTSEERKLMHRAFALVVPFSNARVSRTPAFFTPSFAVDVEPNAVTILEAENHMKVVRGTWRHRARLVVQYPAMADVRQEQAFLQSAAKWHALEHPNLAQVLGASHIGSEPFVILDDVASQGNFVDYFGDAEYHERHHGRFWRMFLQAARGLSHMHKCNVTHGRLKCTHILVGSDGTVKIADLGMNSLPHAMDFYRWKSPECLVGSGPDPSKPGDIYSFGLCMIEAWTGDMIYGTDADEDIIQQLSNNKPLPRPRGMRDSEWTLVEQLCALDPEARPEIAAVVAMLEVLVEDEQSEET